jgi:hypothetical protein
MRRRLALLFTALLWSAAAHAADPARPPLFSVTLGGGFSYRDTTFLLGNEGQAQTTRITGTSPFLGRLRADGFFLPWLGVEAEGSFDSFQAIKPNEGGNVSNRSTRASGRAGVALRFLNPVGFLLNGSVGYGIASVPVIRITTVGMEPNAGGILSHGLVGRVGIGYSGERFEAIAGFLGHFSLNRAVTGYEPQVWLAGRVADIGSTALWVGLDSGLLLETSPIGYSGPTFRFAVAVKLELLPPAPPPKPIVDVPTPGSETTLRVEVLLPAGTPATGALVTLDSGEPAQVDAMGQLVVKTTPGAHAVSAKLSGYRPATGNPNAAAGKSTLVSLQLEALTGPGQLSGVVRASATGQPVPEATVTAGDLPPVQTGADGTYRFASIGPGPVKVTVQAQGFTLADEVAQVPPESAATLDVQLEPLGKGSPATVRGLVRSRTGEAIKASVTIKGNPTKVTVNAEGRFFVTVPGGTYLFVISAPGHVTQTKKVVLADGDQAILHADLQKVSK